MRKNINTVLFAGAVWGMAEATAGHFLHTFSLGFGWLLWFPIAFFFLNMVYVLTKKPICMLYTAFLAASIKMLDIFFTTRVDIVVNPSVSIIFEAAAVYAVFRHRNGRVDLSGLLVAWFAYRALYICYLFYVPGEWFGISVIRDTISFAKFFFLETVANTLIIFVCQRLFEKIPVKGPHINPEKYSPIAALLSLAAAAAIQIML